MRINTRISLLPFLRDYIGKPIYGDYFFGGKIGKNEINGLYRSIISIMAEDARIKVTKIAEKTKAPHSTIVSRIRRLEKNKTITGYYLLINSDKLGMQTFNLIIKVTNFGNEELSKLKESCRIHNKITWLIETFGDWNFEVGIEVEDSQVLQEVLNKLKTEFKKIVKIDILNLFNTIRYNLYPFN